MDTIQQNRVADYTLPQLVDLVQARMQARWQWQNCENADKHQWAEVIKRIDSRIERGENAVKDRLGLVSFRVKRRIVE